MKHSKEPKIIIIIGPPGSGKGTQAELLAEKFNLFHLETSKIIEANLRNIKKSDVAIVEGKKYPLTEEKKKRETGLLMSPPLILFWIENKVKELKEGGKGIIFSGSPRTLYEGDRLVPFLKKMYGKDSVEVIVLEISPEESIWRNSRRKTCDLMRHSILFSKETAKLTRCPFDGSKLLIRKDDASEVIRKRFKEYQERTFPLVKLFKRENLKVGKINGKQTVAKVFEDILKTLR